MATITVQEINGPYVGSADTTPMSTLTWTAASTGADTIVIPNKRILLLLRNGGATPRAVTVASNFDAYGRKGDISGVNRRRRYLGPHLRAARLGADIGRQESVRDVRPRRRSYCGYRAGLRRH